MSLKTSSGSWQEGHSAQYIQWLFNGLVLQGVSKLLQLIQEALRVAGCVWDCLGWMWAFQKHLQNHRQDWEPQEEPHGGAGVLWISC